MTTEISEKSCWHNPFKVFCGNWIFTIFWKLQTLVSAVISPLEIYPILHFNQETHLTIVLLTWSVFLAFSATLLFVPVPLTKLSLKYTHKILALSLSCSFFGKICLLLKRWNLLHASAKSLKNLKMKTLAKYAVSQIAKFKYQGKCYGQISLCTC